MKTKSKITAYIIHSIAAAVLLLTAQISLAGSATWLLSPQDSLGKTLTTGRQAGRPMGRPISRPSPSPRKTGVNVSTSQEVNSIVFTSDADSFTLAIPSISFTGGGELIISGTGVINNSSVLQTFETDRNRPDDFQQHIDRSERSDAHCNDVSGLIGGGQTIFNDTSSAGRSTLECPVINAGAGASHYGGGQTIFNDTSTAANASIDNWGSRPSLHRL